MAQLPENDRLTGPFLATAGQTDFPGDFPLIDAPGDAVGSCVMFVRERAGVSVELDLGDFIIPATGENSFTLRLAIPSVEGDRCWIVGRQREARLRAHVTNGAVRTPTLEDDAREATARSQEARRDLGRSLQAPLGEALADLPAASVRRAGVLGFADTDGAEPVVHELEEFRGPRGFTGGNIMSVGTVTEVAGISTNLGANVIQTTGGVGVTTPAKMRRLPAAPAYTKGVVRALDRFLPTGAIDAIKGGYFEIAELTVVPDMFPGANDTDKVQNAWRFCQERASDAANGGSMLLLPRIYTTAGLDIDLPNVTIKGLQMGRFYDGSGGGGLKLADNSNRSLIRITDLAGAGTLEDLYLNCNAAAQTAGHGIEYVAAAGGVSTESSWQHTRVRIRNIKQDGINQGLGRRGMNFNTVAIYDVGRTGLYLGGSDNTVITPIIGHCALRGVQVANWTNEILGGDIWDCGTGIFADGVSTQGLTIKGTKLDRHQAGAIYIDDSISPAVGVLIDGIQAHENGLGATAAPTIYLGAEYAEVVNCNFRPKNDGTAGSNNYNIFVPSARASNRHHIHSNTAVPNASAFGLLNYRGLNTDQVLSRNTTFLSPVGFNGAAPISKPITTGYRATRVNGIFAALANVGLLTDNGNLTASDEGWDVILTDLVAPGVAGGGAAAGANVRTITSVALNRGGFCTVGTPPQTQFTLTAGTYLFYVIAEALKVNGHKLYLNNVTAGANAAESLVGYAGAAADVMTSVMIEQSITIAVTSTFQIDHVCETARATDGLGRSWAGASGRYFSCYIKRIA